jgi:hypothetical protein
MSLDKIIIIPFGNLEKERTQVENMHKLMLWG